jgi:hypothetical protein
MTNNTVQKIPTEIRKTVTIKNKRITIFINFLNAVMSGARSSLPDTVTAAVVCVDSSGILA